MIRKGGVNREADKQTKYVGKGSRQLRRYREGGTKLKLKTAYSILISSCIVGGKGTGIYLQDYIIKFKDQSVFLP